MSDTAPMIRLVGVSALLLAATATVQAVIPESDPWADPSYRNAEGWRVCSGYLDRTPEERATMPAWCEDWATGDV
jgi:hypothetical protein